MPAPQFAIFADALQVALRAARTDEESAASMGDFLYSTAAVKGEVPWYRPFEAAASWLESDAGAMVKGEGGFTLADRPTAIASLRTRQREEDVRAGLIVSTSVRHFAGVSR